MITFKEYLRIVREGFDADEFARHMAKLRTDSKKTDMEKLVSGLHDDDKHKEKMKKTNSPNKESKSDSQFDPYSPYSSNSIYKHN